ncbi:hypothetical protein HZH68_006239 [Vespula germanica]|uniref:Uncharacterized protein n=1 Tax=Vespula germanica TaxID=30212 RepID=A0A834NC17_VESGE|nr:hypothetical protein HZH68_006239 [Vespula germanica]
MSGSLHSEVLKDENYSLIASKLNELTCKEPPPFEKVLDLEPFRKRDPAAATVVTPVEPGSYHQEAET